LGANETGKRRNWGRRRHSHYSRKRALMQRGLGAIDARTISGRKAIQFRVGIISDLGGDGEISMGKLVAINRATGILWELCEIDQYEIELIVIKGSIVNKQTRSLPPVILEKHRLEDTLIKLLDRIYEAPAWRRRQKRVSLTDLLQQGEEVKEAEGGIIEGPEEQGDNRPPDPEERPKEGN